MSLVIDTVNSHLPFRKKHTPSGWTSFNAVCCHHCGNSADKRQRGGIMITQGVTYHCFNCGFKASWQPGRPLSINFKKLLKWLAVPDDIINKCVIEALRLKEDSSENQNTQLLPTFIDKALPPDTRPLKDWLVDPVEGIIEVLDYLDQRGLTVDNYDWHWTPINGFKERLIVPFYYEKKLVGYTARLIRDGKIKYISEQQPGYVFNLDNQSYDRQFAIVCEGPIDAICVEGLAVMTNEINPQQYQLISKLQKQIIVVPDKDLAGIKLIEQAIEWGWSVSMPDWPEGVKDINDSVKLQGKIYTLLDIVRNAESNALKIRLRMKKWIGTQ